MGLKMFPHIIEGGGGELLTHFPTVVLESKTDKIPKSHI